MWVMESSAQVTNGRGCVDAVVADHDMSAGVVRVPEEGSFRGVQEYFIMEAPEVEGAAATCQRVEHMSSGGAGGSSHGVVNIEITNRLREGDIIDIYKPEENTESGTLGDPIRWGQAVGEGRTMVYLKRAFREPISEEES